MITKPSTRFLVFLRQLGKVSSQLDNYTIAQLEKAISSPLTLYELLSTKSLRKFHMSLSCSKELGECIDDC